MQATRLTTASGIPVEDIHTRIERDDSQERSGVYKLSARLQIKGALSDAQLQELHVRTVKPVKA